MSGKPTILITGATGSIGIPLVKKLINEKFNLVVVVRNREKSMQLFSDSVTHVVFDGHTFSEELSLLNTSIVIHLASYSTSKDDKDTIVTLVDSNILFVSLLLDALKNSPLKLFINAGSFSEFHTNNEELHPTYLYSATKTASRFIIDYFSQTYNFTFVNAILYTVYGLHGENKKIIDYMLDSLEAQEPIKMSAGHQILDFVHIDDVICFYLVLIKNHGYLSNYHEYHIGTGKGTSIKELAQQFMRFSCKAPNIQWGAISPRKRDTHIAIANVQPVFNELGWKATIDLETGIKMYLKNHENTHA